jgi:hypothetical protein
MSRVRLAVTWEISLLYNIQVPDTVIDAWINFLQVFNPEALSAATAQKPPENID